MTCQLLDGTASVIDNYMSAECWWNGDHRVQRSAGRNSCPVLLYLYIAQCVQYRQYSNQCTPVQRTVTWCAGSCHHQGAAQVCRDLYWAAYQPHATCQQYKHTQFFLFLKQCKEFYLFLTLHVITLPSARTVIRRATKATEHKTNSWRAVAQPDG